MLIRNVRPLNGDPVDLLVHDGRIAAIGPNLTPEQHDVQVTDGGGRLLFPGFVDAHAHMDKTLLGMGWYRNEVGPNPLDQTENERAVRRERDIDAHRQSMRQARRAIADGTTHIRTFVDIDTEVGLAGFEGVMRTREEMRDALDIQVVAFPQSGMLARPGTVDLMEQALKDGAHVVGGLDPSSIDRDPAGHLNVIFGMAERYDVDVDIHLHEPGELGAFSVELIAERTRALGWQGRVVISHAFCLGGVDEAHYGRLVDLLLDNDIAIMSIGPSRRSSACGRRASACAPATTVSATRGDRSTCPTCCCALSSSPTATTCAGTMRSRWSSTSRPTAAHRSPARKDTGWKQAVSQTSSSLTARPTSKPSSSALPAGW
jgi:cytosine/creatinine deaminase